MSTYRTHHASSSRPAPSLSINTARSNARSTSPTKGPIPKLYQLPPALESPEPSNPTRRARPGGLAGMSSDISDSRSFMSDRPGRGRRMSNSTARRGSDFTLSQGVGDGWVPTSPTRDHHDPGPSQEQLQAFAHHCRAFYLASSPPSESASYISSTLASVPASHRTVYTKLQSALRALAHLHHLRVRISSFHALLSSTYASGSLTPASRSLLDSYTARAERRDKLSKVISTWCTGTGAGGVEPFFKGLWAVLRVQSRPDAQRGDRRVVWEIDDAVFLESGGMEFMHEAVILLKGVLGFTDQPLTSPPRLRRIRTLPKAFAEARSRRLTSPQKAPTPNLYDAESLRTRSTSDPFNDARPSKLRTSSRGPAPPPPTSRRNHPLDYPVEDPVITSSATAHGAEEQELLLSTSMDDDVAIVDEDPTEDDIVAEEAELNRPRFRLWTFPAHITDEEADDLLRLFPRAISKGRDVRFPYIPPGHGILAADLNDKWEAVPGQDIRVPKIDHEPQEGVLRYGTGRMWTGLERRNPNHGGSGWFRFKRWWRRLFGLA